MEHLCNRQQLANPQALGANDRESTSLAVVSYNSTGTNTITLNAAGIALVQRWVNAPSSNHGMILNDPGTNGDRFGF